MADEFETPGPPLKEFTKGQRRVLGVLLEKAFTTPEAYPLTPKGLVAGCNQKNNRHPITNYNEDDVLQYIDELRAIGLVAVVHTESGRTERFRHYLRKRYQFSEAQLAILTELLLRGKQSLGDLRGRASRMVSIPSLEELRDALRDLIEQNIVQADGPLERRGVEVDHNLYQSKEGNVLTYRESADDEPGDGDTPARPAASSATADVSRASQPGSSNLADRLSAAEGRIAELHAENAEMRQSLDKVQAELSRVAEIAEKLQRDLGG